MKGLSMTQPWATLVARRAKRIETRSWGTTYRGLIAIHASKAFPRDCQTLCYEDPFYAVLGTGPGLLPRGAIIAVARLVNCVPTERILLDPLVPAHAVEREFGDYSVGRWAWVIQGVRQLPEPVTCKGALGLWTVPADVERHLTEVVRL